MNKKLIIIILAIISITTIKAQDVISPSTNTTSPYSRYGYGVLMDKGIGASRGMGGISYGLRGQNVNPGNPASYSSVDSLTFIFDIGISYSNAKLSQSGASQNDHNGGLDYLAIQFPVSKWMGISVGFLPYSSVGYSFGSTESIGNTSYQKYFSGSGGINQIYGGVGFGPFKGVSFGANVAYLHGNITHNRSLPLFSDNSAHTSYEERKLSVNGAKFDVGVQYQTPILNKKKQLIIGATYSPSISPSSRVKGETIVTNGDTLTLESADANIKFPHTFGFGFTVSDRKLLFGADVTFQKWKDLSYPAQMNDSLTTSNRFNNRWRFNAGVEYVINPMDRNFFKRMKFRGGINYSNSYLNVQSAVDKRMGGYNEYGVTLGLGLPFRDNYTGRVSYVNISFEYTRLSPEFKSTMVKEEYFGVSLNVNMNDLWFMKNKFK